MNKINRKVEYALIGLKAMVAKRPGELTSAKEISLVYGAPFEVMSRVMQTLVQQGVLRSEQGAHGGYQIMRDLTRLSFFELHEMVLGQLALAKCIDGDEEGGCEMRGTCNIVSPVHNLNKKLAAFYRSLSIAELLETHASKMSSQRSPKQQAVMKTQNSIEKEAGL